MDFKFTDEQRDAALDSAVWRQLAELGVTALNVPEADGGLGGGSTDTLLAQLALAPGLLLEPVLASAVIATRLLSLVASGAQREVLAAMAAGDHIVVLAHTEPQGGQAADDPGSLATVAERQGDGRIRLSGRKAVVLHAPCAHEFIVSALEVSPAGARTTLWRLAADAPGLQLRTYRNLDGQPAADLEMNGILLPASAQLGDPQASQHDALQQALDAGLAAMCAEAVGIMDAMVAATAEYLRVRQQFGQPLGRFQALQHRMADMLMHAEQARSMAYLAAIRCTEADPHQRARFMSAAKVVVGQAGRFISQQAVQLHGGMGMTDELIISHYFKRLAAIELSMGHTDEHLQRFAKLSYGSH